jgi:hypothetical protein
MSNPAEEIAVIAKKRSFGRLSVFVIWVAVILGLFAIIFSKKGLIAQYHLSVVRSCGAQATYSFKSRYNIYFPPGSDMGAAFRKCWKNIDSLSRIDTVTISLKNTNLSDDDFRFLLRIRGSLGVDVGGTNVTDKAIYSVMYVDNIRVGLSSNACVSKESLAEYSRVRELLQKDFLDNSN